jgi:heat-inducible transcriptional repressor
MRKKDVLTQRKLRVLREVVSEFINTAEPVSSKAIAKKSSFIDSPATIRSEMSDLERMGFLYHPHTSSGRVPSDSAYRLYVNELISSYELPESEKRRVAERLYGNMKGLGNVLQNITSTLSEITNLTAFAVSPNKEVDKITSINILPVGGESAVFTIVSEAWNAYCTVIDLDEFYGVETFALLSEEMTVFYKGKTITDALKDEVIERFLSDLTVYESIVFEKIVPSFIKALEKMIDTDVYFDGVGNIFSLPEFSSRRDNFSLSSFIKHISNKQDILGILSGRNEGLDITIGSENKNDLFKDNTLITATYHVGGKFAGKLGVIGPTRMEYEKVTSIIRYLTENIDDVFSGDF